MNTDLVYERGAEEVLWSNTKYGSSLGSVEDAFFLSGGEYRGVVVLVWKVGDCFRSVFCDVLSLCGMSYLGTFHL